MLVHSATSVAANAVAMSITQHAAEHACPAAWIDAQPTCHGRGQMACWAEASISRDARGFGVCRLPHPTCTPPLPHIPSRALHASLRMLWTPSGGR